MNGTEIRAVLAGNIRILRKRRNWSQADLAEKTGLSIVYLSDIERGNKWPYLDTLLKLSEALDVEIFELLMPDNIPASKNTSSLYKYTSEVNSIVEKSVETLEKNTKKALAKLREQYIG
jgi:transcriptional regulator with XRE-family HTH domain